MDPLSGDNLNSSTSLSTATSPYADEPYRDDSAASAAAPPLSHAQLFAAQQGEIAQQDTHLDNLSASIARQRELGLRMCDELELHGELLEEMNGAVDGTANRLDRARGRLDTLERSVKQHGELTTMGVWCRTASLSYSHPFFVASTYTIIFLVVALALYVFFIK